MTDFADHEYEVKPRPHTYPGIVGDAVFASQRAQERRDQIVHAATMLIDELAAFEDGESPFADLIYRDMGIEKWQLDNDVDLSESLQEEFTARLNSYWLASLLEATKHLIPFYGGPS